VTTLHDLEGVLGRPLATFFWALTISMVMALGSCVKWFHLEAGPIHCVRGLKSSLVIGQKAQIGANPFTPRGRANLVV
jgi:hypothetical protein